MKKLSAALTLLVSALFSVVANSSVGEQGITPSSACSILKSSGYKGRLLVWSEDKYAYDENNYACSSDYKELPKGPSSFMANNIAYYVKGTKSSVKELKLVANINDKSVASSAHKELLSVANVLVKNTTGQPLSAELSSKVISGSPFKVKVSGVSLDFIKEDWPTGAGYELKFIVK